MSQTPRAQLLALTRAVCISEATSMREQPALCSAMQSAVPLHPLHDMSCTHGAKAAACAEGCTCCFGHPLSELWNVGQVVDLCASLIGALSEVRLGKVADHFFTVRARSWRIETV